jgi:adenine-specific DNA-methyltransferase
MRRAFDKLKTAPKVDVDEEAWASLYRTEIRPFAQPRPAGIAVQVINHYGDKVLRGFMI